MPDFSTVYVSTYFENKIDVPPFKEMIPKLNRNLARLCDSREDLLLDEDKRSIIYGATIIEYRLYYSSVCRRYFLSFYPKNIWSYAKKKDLETAFKYTIEFFQTLNDQISIYKIGFIKNESFNLLDISDWKFKVFNSKDHSELSSINDISVREFAETIYSGAKNRINRKLLIIDGSNFIQKIANVDRLKRKVQRLFQDEPEVIPYSTEVLEIVSQRYDLKDLYIFFIGDQKTIDGNHQSFKKFLIPNNIPSQFISIANLNNKLKFGLVNFIIEIIKKASIEPIALEPIDELNQIDGILCLSDLASSSTRRYFGVSMLFTGGSIPTEDYLEIYNDIGYSSKHGNIYFKEGQISKLVKKLNSLSSLRGKKIDIICTKKWKAKDISFFLKELGCEGINVRKCIYISHSTNRFLFSDFHIIENRLKHPYFIIDGKVGSIQTNTELKLFGTMFPMYVELLNSWEQRLEETDLKIILWLVKKRLYRLKSFYSLKVPENITIFSEVKNLGLEDISGTLKLSINHLL